VPQPAGRVVTRLRANNAFQPAASCRAVRPAVRLTCRQTKRGFSAFPLQLLHCVYCPTVAKGFRHSSKPHGKKQYTHRTFSGIEDNAETALCKLFAEVDEGNAPTSGSPTLKQYLQRWQKDRRMSVRASTLAHQQRMIDLHIVPMLGRYRLSKITKTNIDALYSELSLTLSSTTVWQVKAVLRKALNDAVPELIPYNPTKKAKKPKVGKDHIEVPSHQAVAGAIAAASPVIGMAMSILVATGLRRSELLAPTGRISPSMPAPCA
jgi:hypothetical protein